MRYDESDIHGEVHVLAGKETIQGGVCHMHARECNFSRNPTLFHHLFERITKFDVLYIALSFR